MNTRKGKNRKRKKDEKESGIGPQESHRKEERMNRILRNWRWILLVLVVLVAIAAYMTWIPIQGAVLLGVLLFFGIVVPIFFG